MRAEWMRITAAPSMNLWLKLSDNFWHHPGVKLSNLDLQPLPLNKLLTSLPHKAQLNAGSIGGNRQGQNQFKTDRQKLQS